MSVAVRRLQVVDTGSIVDVDITLTRAPGAPTAVRSHAVPPDVRNALVAWLLPEGHAVGRAQVHVYDDAEVERLCEVMHDAYESAAQVVGWETQTRSRKPWDMVPEANKRTMRVAVRTLLEAL